MGEFGGHLHAFSLHFGAALQWAMHMMDSLINLSRHAQDSLINLSHTQDSLINL